ncbi:MAG: HEAT repeat domain-containing protein [Chitinispirillaceae bacterium]|nr:HEAT repeat domain-containing protein [Chitinispirillaceae bacterium]
MKRCSIPLLRLSVLLLLTPCIVHGLTRWSSLQTVPDADFIESWNYVLDYQGYYFTADSADPVLKNIGQGRLGLSEWANVTLGYAGGFSLGLKAKVLSENASMRPSVAIGVHNILAHREDHLYGHDSAAWSYEPFVAGGKTIEAIKLRLHFGVQTMPEVKKERVTWFAALEKYLGSSAYVAFEAQYRDEKVRPSVFASVRLFKKHLQLAAGAVDFWGMYRKNREPASGSPPLVQPGFWLGVSFMGNMASPNSSGGFSSLEEQVEYQRNMIIAMKRDVDSIKRVFSTYTVVLDTLNKRFNLVADSALGATSGQRLQAFAMERLVKLNTLFARENIDAEQIKTLAREIVSYGDIMVPVLRQIVLDPQVERRVHIQAMTRLGQIGTAKAADAVIDILPQSQDPDVRIEGLIALGAMKDRRASYLIEQLAHDPHEAVAFTAAEVLQKLENRAPAKKDSLALTPLLPSAIPDKKIGSGEAEKPGAVAEETETGGKRTDGVVDARDETKPKTVEKKPSTPPVPVKKK